MSYIIYHHIISNHIIYHIPSYHIKSYHIKSYHIYHIILASSFLVRNSDRLKREQRGSGVCQRWG